MNIPVLMRGEDGVSVFEEVEYELEDFNGMMISPRIGAQNFRHRKSEPEYASDWHVAGDATLIIVRSGMLRVGLRDGSWRDFGAGEMFVAQDFLAGGEEFDDARHGHRAEVIGDNSLLAVHLKLMERVSV